MMFTPIINENANKPFFILMLFALMMLISVGVIWEKVYDSICLMCVCVAFIKHEFHKVYELHVESAFRI